MKYHGPLYGKISRRYIPLKLTSEQIDAAVDDSKRIDWLADTANTIGNVTLPTRIVEQNLTSLRDAIDAAMKLTIDIRPES